MINVCDSYFVSFRYMYDVWESLDLIGSVLGGKAIRSNLFGFDICSSNWFGSKIYSDPFFFKVRVGMALKWSLVSLYLILISLSLIKNEGIHQQMQQLRLFLCFLSLCCSTCYIAVFINFSSCYWLSSFLCFVSSPCIWICCQIFVVIKNCKNCILSDGSIISVTSYC